MLIYHWGNPDREGTALKTAMIPSTEVTQPSAEKNWNSVRQKKHRPSFTLYPYTDSSVDCTDNSIYIPKASRLHSDVNNSLHLLLPPSLQDFGAFSCLSNISPLYNRDWDGQHYQMDYQPPISSSAYRPCSQRSPGEELQPCLRKEGLSINQLVCTVVIQAL